MTKAGVEGPTTAVVLAPGDRVVTHRAPGVRLLVQAEQDLDRRPRVGSKVVPLVGADPRVTQVCSGRGRAIIDVDRSLLDFRVAVEVATDKAAVPRPVVPGIGRCVDADVTAASRNVGLERDPLGVAEDIAGGGQPDDAWYWARFCSVNCPESSVVVTVKPLLRPSCTMAAIPLGMEVCRNPAVLEKISTFLAVAADTEVVGAQRTVPRKTAQPTSRHTSRRPAEDAGGAVALSRCDMAIPRNASVIGAPPTEGHSMFRRFAPAPHCDRSSNRRGPRGPPVSRFTENGDR